MTDWEAALLQVLGGIAGAIFGAWLTEWMKRRHGDHRKRSKRGRYRKRR